MEYFLISLAAVFIAGQFSLSKLYQIQIKQDNTKLLAMPVIVAAVSALLFLCLNAFSLKCSVFGVGIAACVAINAVLAIYLNVVVVRLGRVSVFSMFMMLGGMLLPYFYGALFLKEELSVFRIVGITVLIVALVMSVWGESGGQKPKKLFYVLCLVIFVLNGATGVFSKIHQISPAALPTYDFLIWLYLLQLVFSGAALGVYLLFKRKKSLPTGEPTPSGAESRSKPIKKRNYALLTAVAFAVVCSLGYLMQLIAAVKLPASALYPFLSGGSVVFTTIAAAIFFHEKITRRTLISLILLLIGTVLFVF